MERFIPVESFRWKVFTRIPENFCTICPLVQCQALHSKMAADFQNVYRYYMCLCSLVALADVLEHNCNPADENELRFVVGTCVFLSHSSVLPPELHRGKKCGCCSSLKEEIVAFSQKKKTISKSSDKTSSTRGSSDAMFLVDVPRPRLTGIRKFRSNDTVQSI